MAEKSPKQKKYVIKSVIMSHAMTNFVAKVNKFQLFGVCTAPKDMGSQILKLRSFFVIPNLLSWN